MSILTRPLTYLDLEHFPDDGKRYEVVYGELHVSAAPDRRHQRLLTILTAQAFHVAETSGAGQVFVAPVDVRPLGTDQVQPDLIFIRRERLHLYQGHVVHGPSDLAIEVLSPSTRTVDESTKKRFYEEAGVPEYWIADFDPLRGEVRPFALRDGRYAALAADADGTFRSGVLPTFAIDPVELFAALDD